MDCSLPDSSVFGIFQARILEWLAISFSGIYSIACLLTHNLSVRLIHRMHINLISYFLLCRPFCVYSTIFVLFSYCFYYYKQYRQGHCWLKKMHSESWVQFSSVAQLCPILCDPMDCSNQASLFIANSWSLLKLMAIESVMPSSPFHPQLSPCPPAFSLSQHQGLFQWVNSSYQVTKVLEFQFQHQSFQWTPRSDLL